METAVNGRVANGDANGSSTTISTIVVQSGKGKIVVAVLHSLQDIQLRIADAMPGLLEVGRSLEEAKRLKKQHEDLMGKLKGKQGHVNELLHQADNVVINKEPDLDVYEAMAESLGEAWKDLNAQLEDRRLLLDAAILFHESVKQFTDKLNVAHRLFSPLTLPQDVDIIRMQLQKHHQTKKEILEASMETMNRGQVLLDRMQDMGSHLDSKHATTAACYGVEHMLENLHDRRRHMEEVWALQKLRLEKSLQLCIWKQEVNDVTAFYKSQGESYMNASNLGENAPATQILVDLHREITDKAKPMYDQVKRLLRVAESFIVGGHYDSPTIQSMAGNLHVQWETFMDRLDRRTKYLQMAFDFYTRAGEAVKRLEQIDMQLSAHSRQVESTAKLAMLHASLAQEILETVSPPLHDGYILIDLIGRGKPQLAGIEQKVDELEGWKKDLEERCQAHLEDAQQKGEMFLVFQERHAHLFTWLTGVVDTFLAMHADMGTILPAALEFLSNHERLEKDMKDREPQVDIVLQAAEEFMRTGAVEAHECDVKTRDIQDHWGRVGRVVAKRISLGAIYVAFHKLARRLANEMDDLDELLKRTPTDGTKGLEIAIHRHDDQWKEVREAFTVMERKGREFLSEVKLVRDDPQLDTERAVLCVETLLEHFGERKRTIQDQRTSWQQKLQAEEQFKQDWLRFMEEVKKTIEWIVSLEREIFPSSGADLGTNLEDAVDLQDKLRKFMPTAEKTSDVVEGHVKTAEMLAARGETGPQKDSLIMDLLRVHQRFQARLAEYILLLEMAIAFFDNINKLNMLIDKADKDFKQTSPQDVKQVEDFLRQHEAVKKDVSKVFNHTTDSGERIVLRVRENDGVDAARVTVEQALTMLDMRRIQWLKEWDDQRRRLEQGIKMCQLLKDIEKLREQLSELADGLQEFQSQLKEAKTSHTISIIMQKFEDFTSQVTTFRYRFEGLSGQVDEALKEGWDNLAPLLSKRKELRDQWQRFMQEFDAFGTRLPLAHQLFTNMQEIEAWLVETTKMLFELEQQAKAVKTKEEAKALLPPVEQKAKEAEMQEGRCRYVSELSVRVHGKDEGEKATRHVVVQFHEVRETITYVRTEIKTKIQTLPSKHDLDMKPQIEVIKKVETPTQFALLSPPPPKKKIVPPSFAQKLTSAVVDEGSPFRFECRVEGDPTPAITWYKDNDNIASSSIYETAFINNVASLTIAEVFVEDEARYMCKASNPGGQAICSAKLTVKALETEPPPQPPILNMNLQDIQVMEGEEITLVVKVTAYPQPDVYWFCDGQPVKESSGVRIVLQGVDTFSLVIKEAFPEDSGMYSVLAKNAHGEAHGSCKVTVERYAETTDTEVMSDSEYVAPTVYETLKDRDVLEGSKIRMDCVIIGTPEPEIIWYFKDKPLKESHNKMLLFEGDKCSLVINEARYSDRGEYKCVAINPAGKAETAMTLEVEPLPATDGYLTDESKMAPKKPDIPPVFVQNFEERIYYEGAEARLTCRVQGRPAPTVTWYKDDVQVVPTDHIRIVQIGDTHSVMFKHVGEEDYGIYMCVAVNRAGSVSRCGHVSLKGPGMEPPRFTQELADARGVEGTPVGLVCRVTGKPEPSVVFYRDGNVIHESEDFKIVIQGDLCSLLIPEVLVQDEGKYMARAVNPAGEATTAAVLRVEGEARPPTFIKKLDKQLKVKEGRVVMLEVMVDGCPKPKVKWFMDEEPVMSQDYDIIVDGGRHALTIKEVFDEDAGVFKCRAKNSQGEVTCTCQLSVVPPSSDEERERAEASVVQQPVVQPTVQPVVQPAVQPVLVEEPPMEVERVPEPPIIRNMEPPKFVQPIRSIAVVEGKRAEFEGLVTGDPQPEVTWYKDGQDCTQNPDFEIAYIEGHAKLVIPEVFDEDAGKYTCKAKNQAGTAASTAELVVKAVTEPPDFTQRLQSMQVNEGAEVRLEVRISGVPTPEIKWFREGAEIQTSHDFQIIREGDLSALVIREAFSEDSGKFSVMASNSVGRATSAAHLVITAAEESVAMEATTTEQVQITQAQTQAQQMDLGSGSGYEPGVTEVREAVVSAAARRVVGGVQYGEQTVSAQQVAVAEEEQRRAVQMEVEEAQAPPPAPPAEPEAMETGISQPVFQKQAGQQQIYQQTHGKDPMQQVHQMRAMQQQVQNMQQQQQQLQPHQMQQMLQLQQQQQQMQQQQHQMQHQVQSTQHLQQPVFTMQQVEGLQQMAPVRTVQQLPGMQQQVTGMQQVPGTQQQHVVYQQQHATVRHNPGTQPTHFTNTTGYTTGYTPAHVLGEQMQPALAAIHPASVIHMGHAKERVYKAHPEEVMGSPGQRRRALIQLHEGIHADFDACIPYFPKALSDISAEEGECVIFECLVLGEPRPHVKWFREGAEIESSPDFTISQEGDVARLVISEVFIDDAGKFTCTALNEAGSRSCYCFLHVNAAVGIEVPPPPPPPPKVEEGPHDFVVDSTKGISKPTFTARLMPCKYVEGQTVIFKIPVDGNPRPEISWTFNGVKLESGVRHMISYEMGFAMLSISMLLPEDCGEYAVTASSPSGQATQKARLMTEAEYEMWLREEEEKAKKAQRISLVTEMEEKFSASETEGEAVIKPSEAGLTRKAGIAEARIIESKISMEGYGEYLEAKKSGASPERGPRARSRSPRRDTTEPGVKEKHFRPQIVQRPEDLEVIEGQMARFDLKVSGRPPPDIQWFLNGQPVLDDATHKAVVNEGGIRSLLIIPATPDDSGEYTCVAVNRAGKASFTVRLNVVPRVIGERPEFLQRIQNVQVQEGAPAEMRTRIHGVPYPQIAWQKDGYTISERPGLRMMNQDGMVSLMFDLTDKEDDGWYTAVAFNSAGTVATRCKLTVIPTLKKAEPPQRLVVAKSKRTAEFKREEVTAISKFGEETVDEEDLYDKTRKQRPVFKTKISPVNLEGMGRAHFECRLVPIGDPNMKVEWLNNGQPIEAANRLQYVNEFGFVSMDYLVAYPRDTGIITCRATNQHGEAETSSRLVVKDVPGKIEETQLPEGMRGISKLTEYERKLRESTMRTYVDEAEPEFEKAPPEIVMPPEGCRVVEGEQAKFHCRITGHPQPKVRWYLNGTIIRKSKRFRVWYDGIFHFEIPECKTLYAGEVKVVAENSQGTAETVVPLEVQLKEDYRTILKTPPKTAADPDLRRYHRLKGREEITIKRDRSPGFEMPKLKKVEKVSKEKSEAELASVELQKKFQKRFEPGYYEKLAGMELKGITKEEIKIEAKPLKKREVAVEAAPMRAAPPPEKKPKKEPGMEEPKFIQKLQNQKLKPGEQCRFEARVSGKPEPRVSWFKNGAEITASERIQISRDGSTCVLSIPNPDHEDSGTYVCKADNAAGTASCTAFLLVPKVVELGFTRDLTDVTAQERDATAVFEADVNQEFTKPRWYKDGQEISMGDKYQQQVMRKCLMLVVRNVTLQDAGQYTCQVEKATSSATLTVTGLPLEVKKPLQNMEAMETGAVTFEIELSQDDLEHQWFHNGVALANSDRVQIKLHRHFFYRLTLKDLAFEDAGEYKFKCRDVTATAQLVVTERPLEVTRSLQPVTCYETETASFEVEISHEGIEVQWQRKGSILAPSDRVTIEVSGCVHRLTISNVSQSDAGEYAVVIGDFRQTTQLTVEIRKLEFTRPLQNIKIFEKQTATFEVEINFSGVDVQWLKNGEAIAPSDKFRVHADQKVHRLEILNVTVDDSGEYSFVALDTKATATLYVDTKHVEFIRKIYEPVRCSPGETATFELEISEEDVEGQWFRNEVTLSTSDKYRFEQVGGVRRLYISNVSLEDQGDYSFVANDAQTSVTLYVEVKYVEFRRKPMETITVKPNEVATFEFEVTDQYKDVDVSWYRNEIRIETGEKYKVERDRCVHRLLIADTEQGDSGEYVFVAGETREVVTLYVEAAHVEMQRTIEAFEVVEYQTATLQFEIDEDVSAVQWLHNDKEIYAGEKYQMESEKRLHKLSIINITQDDAGNYTLVAGEARYTTTLIVKPAELELAAPQFTQTLKSHIVEAGEPIRFHGTVSGHPPPQISWLKNGQPIAEGDKYKFVTDGNTHTLLVINAAIEDSAEYACVASNDVGMATSSAQLLVEERGVEEAMEEEVRPPRILEPIQGTETREGEGAGFTCRIEGTEVDVTWYRNDSPIKPSKFFQLMSEGEYYVLNISEAFPEDAGTYKVVAVNPAGEDQCAADLAVEKAVTEAVKPAQVSPAFIKDLQNQTTPEGSSARFDCRIQGKPDPTVTWYKNGTELKESSDFKMSRLGDVYSLVIVECLPEDSGVILCKAVNPAGQVQSQAQLTVQVDETVVEQEVTQVMQQAPTMAAAPGPKTKETVDGPTSAPNFTQALQGQTAVLGERAKFEAFVTISSDTKIIWLLNGVEIKGDPRHLIQVDRKTGRCVLIITKLQVSDSGDYTLQVLNALGEAACTAQLLFQEKQVQQQRVEGDGPNFTKMLSGQVVEEGSTARMEVGVGGSPAPTVSWLFNGAEIKADQRRKFIADAKQQLYALVIEKVQPSDQGNYTCRAMNKFGEAGCTGQLFVQPPGQKVKLVQGEAPNFLQMLESKAAEEGSTARLEIVVSGNPEPKVSWYHNGKEIRPDQKRQLQYDQAKHLHALVIQKVQSEDDGEYTVKVRNDFGEAACTSSLHTYPPGQQVQLVHGESPNFAQMLESQAVEEGTVAKLEIVTSGTPEPTVTWLFGGVELQADARRQISVDARSHRLVIQQVQEADSGEYTARVQNDFGIAACTAQILVYPRGQKVTIVQEGVQHVKGPSQATQVVQGAGQATQVVQGAGQATQVVQGAGQTFQVVQGQAGQTFQVAQGTTGQTVQVVQGQAGQTFQVAPGTVGQTVQVAQGQTAQGTASQVVQGKVGLEGLSQSIIAAGQRVQAARGTPQSATGGDQVVQVIQGQTVQSGQGIQGGQVTVVGGGQGMMVQGSQGTMVVQGGGTMVQGGQVTMVQGGQGTMVQGGTMVVQGTSQQSLQGDPPNFGKMPDSQAVEEGGTAKFETIVTGSPEPEVAWLHNGQELKSDGRWQISTDLANHHHVLVIQKLTKADAGKYTARVGNQFGEAACTAELHVVPPGQKVKMVKGESPNFAKMLDSQAVEDGGAARFEVVVTGNPEPTVIWQYNGQELEQDQRREVICNKAKGQHVLLIESVQQSDSGDYTARVRNDFGEAACTAQLLVYPPGQKVKLVTGESPNFAKFPSSVAVADGEPARFDAAVTGSPLPKVTWLHMGTEIQSDQRRKVLFDESKKTASIVISQVQPSDGGDYTCQLNNDYGQAACTAQLLVKASHKTEREDRGVAPEILRPCRNIITMEGHTVYFQCKVAGVPLPKVTWYRDDLEVKECGNVTFEESCVDDRTVLVTMVIMNVRMGDHGCYTCHAVNASGETVCQAYLDVQGAKR